MIRVLIVDDSAFMRKVITDLLKKMNGVEPAEIARNGKAAVDYLAAHDDIDLVLMDIEMPIMNGIEAVKQIKQKYSTPVIMLSALSNKEITIEALELGATDFVTKPVNLTAIESDWTRDLERKIKGSQMKKNERLHPTIERDKKLRREVALKEKKTDVELNRGVHALVIGSSTGGPRSLLTVAKALPRRSKVPVFIVQHMPKGFTKSFAERLDAECGPHVVEAQDGMLVEPNTVYLAPGDYHMTTDGIKIYLNQESKLHGTRPAVDYLFKSAAKAYHKHLVAVILTGMGHDGADGMVEIAKNGGYNFAQNKETCVVFGMPRAAIEKDVVNEVLGLDEIATRVNRIVR